MLLISASLAGLDYRSVRFKEFWVFLKLMVNIEIKELGDRRELLRLRDFLLSQSLGYPNYSEWVEKVCIPDLESGWKEAYLAFYDGYLIGNAIFQEHKHLGLLEFKNLRVHSGYRGRYLGMFLAKQIEVENQKNIICDTREKEVVEFLKRMGYREIGIESLYDPENLDIILLKEFETDKLDVITPSIINILKGKDKKIVRPDISYRLDLVA